MQYEPIGTTEVGGEAVVRERGPQGMLIPLTPRQEVRYAQRKEEGAPEPEGEEPTPIGYQGEQLPIDFDAAPKAEPPKAEPPKAEPPKAESPKAESPKRERSAEDAFNESRAVRQEMDALRQKNHMPPRSGTAKRAQYDALNERFERLKAEYAELSRKEAKAPKAEPPKAEPPKAEPTAPRAPTPREAVAGVDAWSEKAPEKYRMRYGDLPIPVRRAWSVAVAEGKGTSQLAEELGDKYVKFREPEWYKGFLNAEGLVREEVYRDEDVALVLTPGSVTGAPLYMGVNMRTGRYTRGDIEDFKGNDFTPEQRETLKKAKQRAIETAEQENAARPDGPWTDATSNVVASPTFDKGLADYTRELLQKLGMTNIKILLLNKKDMQDRGYTKQFVGKYYDIMSAAVNPTKGRKKRLNEHRGKFFIFVDEKLPLEQKLEVLAHEVGHTLQDVVYEQAPQETKDAIRAEYDAWYAKTKGMTIREMLDSVRAPHMANEMSARYGEKLDAPAVSIDQYNYFTNYREWFADQVSRWATSDKEALTIVEKFFKSVADLIRKMLTLVDRTRYAPAESVAKFLRQMGPDSDLAYLDLHGARTGTAREDSRQAFIENYTIDNITRTSEMAQAEPGAVTRVARQFMGEALVSDGASPTTRFRVMVADSAASVAHKLGVAFDNKLRDNMGRINPMGLFRQAQDNGKLFISLFDNGSLVKDPDTLTYRAERIEGVASPRDAMERLNAWAKANGLSFRDAYNELATMMVARRLDWMRRSNANEGTNFLLHKISKRDPRGIDQQIDAMLEKFNAEPALQEVVNMLNEPRIRLVKQLREVGRITEADEAAWSSAVEYVPFDRMEEFASRFRSSKRTGRGVSQVGNLPELIGSPEREVGNALDNYVRNLGWLTGQVLNTDATNTTLQVMERFGFARNMGRNGNFADEHKVKAWVDGEERFYYLDSRWDVKAFKSFALPKGFLARAFGPFADVLRTLVTALPPFAIKQVSDDMQRALIMSGVKNPYVTLGPTLKTFIKVAWYEITGRRHPYLKEFGARGITGEYDFSFSNPALSVLQDFGFIKRPWYKELLHRMEGVTRASDIAVRKAIYDQVKLESGDEALALTRAREFINFRRRGDSDFIASAVATIPFFNAYVQSMDLLYRNATGTDVYVQGGKKIAQQMFIAQLTKLAAFSAIYALAMSDDEDYNKVDLRVRNSNWILPGGFRLPMPGEFGALVKVPIETTLEYLRRHGTKEEMEVAEGVTTILGYAMEQFGTRMVPIPTAIRPVLEAMTNHSFLTGRELVGLYQRELDPAEQATPFTSELARAISTAGAEIFGKRHTMSPILIDNFLNNWFGTTATSITLLTDGVLNPDRMDRPLHKWILLSNYMYDPVATRGVNEAYELREKYAPAHNTLLKLAQQDPDKALKYAEENQKDLVYAKVANAIMGQYEGTRKYKKYLQSPLAAKDMSQEERAAAMEEVRKIENELGLQVRELKTMIDK